MSKLFITGGAGYLGSVLVRQALEAGHQVVSCDWLAFGEASISGFRDHPNFTFLQKDFRNISEIESSLKGCDAIIHLAAIVGDKAYEMSGATGPSVNLEGTIALATAAKNAGVKKFIFASTSSVYAGNLLPLSNEDSPTFAESAYTRDKLLTEEKLSALANEAFVVLNLRLASLFGLSPRMRFDLAINAMAEQSLRLKKINIFGGNQWRPFIHVEDAAKAFLLLLNASTSQVINVGDDRMNYRMSEVGKIFHELSPRIQISAQLELQDKRDYKVRFDKILDEFQFQRERKINSGIIEIWNAIESGKIPDVLSDVHYNHKIVASS